MPGTKLVIVESPAKAQTIKGYLGDGYVVEASVGHVRDLPTPSALPPSMKKGPYSKFAVNVDDGFKAYYQVNPDKKKKVAELRKALKEADELYLATDEDREGEAIAWHLLEVLKPKVPVKRMVFHEITKEAIQRALENTREIDRSLVDAQETRRILDRLYGYEVSPVLWRKVAPSLSAGRVQSVATRLVVDREIERMRHVSASYWSVDTEVQTAEGSFGAKVISVGGRPVATGSDFAENGQLKEKAQQADAVALDEQRAEALAQALAGAEAAILSVTQKPYRRRPAAPFTTSTLQQEASRKLKWNASTTMRVAQSLYESGHITYMRTDSTALSGQALKAAREQVTKQFGPELLPDEPRFYGKVAKGAQEAHEAIRPSGEQFRHPQSLGKDVSAQQLALYDLIWKRTLASQMIDAQGYTATIKVSADAAGEEVVSSASGTVITQPGFRLLYQESRDQGRYDKEKGGERELPAVAEGESVSVASATADGHQTQPPGRYTEATLVKIMEDLGIGRPSTYAATIQTISDRGYVTHRGQYLVPTWLAFSVTRLLVENLADLVDYDFTAEMEQGLDRIAAGEEQGPNWLKGFYFGNQSAKSEDFAARGLRDTVENLGDIDARAVNSIEVAEGITLRIGRYGPYLETADGKRASVPPEIAPDEMNEQVAHELLEEAAADGRELGEDPDSGHLIIAKTGRYGPYVTEVLPEDDKGKPRTASLFKSMDLKTVTLEEALKLLSLPREVGVDPADGEMITAQNGRYGPYLKKGSDSRTLASEDQLFDLTLEQAIEIYSQPKQRGRGTAKPPLREFGTDPISGKKVVVKDGRFGPYITDGTTNVTVPRAETVEGLTEERAFTLLADKRAKGPAPKRKAPAKKKTTRTAKK
ncbi:type I DNA topoisomerase [Actinomyces sp. F1_1611]